MLNDFFVIAAAYATTFVASSCASFFCFALHFFHLFNFICIHFFRSLSLYLPKYAMFVFCHFFEMPTLCLRVSYICAYNVHNTKHDKQPQNHFYKTIYLSRLAINKNNNNNNNMILYAISRFFFYLFCFCQFHPFYHLKIAKKLTLFIVFFRFYFDCVWVYKS